MNKTTGTILCIAGLLFSALPAHSASQAAQTAQAPTKELIQYVKDAKRLGLKDAQIKQNAVKAGWPAGVVDEALVHTQSGSQAAAAKTQAAASAAPAVTPKATPTNPPPQPAAAEPTSAAEEPRPDRGVPDDYRIGAGDILQISVWKEPDASVPSVVVRPDGRIAMPLLKEVEVVGLTPRQAEKSITGRLTKFINGADVTVVVTAINSKKIYLIGAVRKEGTIPYTYRMSVMQAISEAGGLTDYAKRKKIYVLRRENGKDFRLPFNYEEVLKGVRMEQNVEMLPNDTIVVPQ